MSKQAEPLVLVGFGKDSLSDLMAKVNDPEGADYLFEIIDRHHKPPRYRRPDICTEEELKVFASYLQWVVKKLGDS